MDYFKIFTKYFRYLHIDYYYITKLDSFLITYSENL